MRNGGPTPETQPKAAPAIALERAIGAASISVRRAADRPGAPTRLADLYQRGSAKIRLPRVHDGPPEAVLLNTAGGLAGGDRFEIAADLGLGAALTVTTQAAERVYRARPDDPPAQMSVRLTLAPGARLAWLPQETILFDGGRLTRRIDVDMAADARALLLESLVLGRRAMGETVRAGAFRDHWRVRRAGRLVHAEAMRLIEPIDAALAGPAAGAGARALASLVYVAPDAAERLEPARRRLAELGRSIVGLEAAATAFDGKLVARLLAADGAALRRAILGFLTVLDHGKLPKVWSL